MTKYLPMAAAAVSGILVGATIVASRFLLAQIGPASLALLRYAVGFCCLLPPALLSSRVRFARRDIPPIALLGITQFGVVVGLLNYALQFIPSARAALIFATFPLMTMLLAWLLGYERLSAAKVAGVLSTIGGVAIALGEKAVQPGGAATEWVGELAVLTSALSGAICSVLYRPYLRKYPTLTLSAFAMLASLLFLALPAASEGFFDAPARLSGNGWLLVAFVGISSGVGYYLWLWALNHTTPTRVTVFLALSPVSALLLGAWFLSETISLQATAGVAAVVVGLWLAHRQARSSA